MFPVRDTMRRALSPNRVRGLVRVARVRLIIPERGSGAIVALSDGIIMHNGLSPDESDAYARHATPRSLYGASGTSVPPKKNVGKPLEALSPH